MANAFSDFPKSRSRVEAARVARLATHNASGAVDLVPITFAFGASGTIVTAVDHKPKRTRQLQRLTNIRHDPSVTLLVDEYEDDWRALWWVRIRGDAVVVDEPSVDLLAPLVAKYPPYREHPPDGPAVVVTVTDVRAWSAGGDY